jgi:predicted Rossmann fold nucleotide-binding protein DprA/Smf involved in DNA uptake
MRSISAEEILETIGATDSQFIYPATEEWPDSLEDLVCPPIALIVRGDISLTQEPTISNCWHA